MSAALPFASSSARVLDDLTRSSDVLVRGLTSDRTQRIGSAGLVPSPRAIAHRLRLLLTSFCAPRSDYWHDAELLPAIDDLLARLRRARHADRTFSIGNLHSPPDSAFVIETLGVLWSLARRDRHADDAGIAAVLGELIADAGPALVIGGVHTPNHRWALCAALAWVDAVAPDPAYGRRIDQWFAEGIDIDGDGQYSERSPNYAAHVTNPALLTLARLTGREWLREPVRRNLDFTLWCTDADGAVESMASRRQDQDRPTVTLADFYVSLRELAIFDSHARYAAAAELVEQSGRVPVSALTELLAFPELTGPLPATEPLPTAYTKIFAGSGLARLRRGRVAATVFGGTDHPERRAGVASTTAHRIASGLSTNPTFLRVSNGVVALESVRMITAFFGLGHFRAAGLRVVDDGRFVLADEQHAAYYQPLSPSDVRPDGDYALEYDGRFFAKMGFSRRERREYALRREVTIGSGLDRGADGEPRALEAVFDVSGVDDVPVTLELCFRPGGTFLGVETIDGTRVLVEGMGRYAVGDDWIEFGPGNGAGLVDADPGEQYRMHNGHRTPAGELVYVTGRTPFHYRLRLRISPGTGRSSAR